MKANAESIDMSQGSGKGNRFDIDTRKKQERTAALEQALEGLEETFPASDAVAVTLGHDPIAARNKCRHL